MSAFLRIDWRRVDAARPPAMLLGGINLARALGLAGIGSIVASGPGFAPAAASRYSVGRCLLPAPAHPAVIAERLVAAAQMLSPCLAARLPLVYGDDDQLALVHRHREALAPHFAFVLNDPELAAALADKGRFRALAEARGLPVPRSLPQEELAGFAGEVVVKPKAKTQWERSPVRRELLGGAGKARRYASGRDALADARVAALAGELAFQEYIPGGDDALWSFHGFADERGELLASFTGRKIRTYPPLTGESSYLELVDDASLDALGRDIAARLRLKGPFKIDLKRHAGNGRFYVLEINARFTLWHYLGAAAGINLAGIAYEYLVYGKRPPRRLPAPRAGVRWINLRLDYLAFRKLHARGELGTAAWLRSLATAPRVCSVFSWRDPLPFVAAGLARARRAPARLRRALRWPSTAS